MAEEEIEEQADDSADEYDGPLLEVNGASYKYGSLVALSDATFKAGAGELIALVGRNGAGKSTLLRCIAGWTRPSDGDVRILGQPVVENERHVREHVVLLPDTPPFYDELTAWEHLQFAAQAHGWNNWEADAEDLLDQVWLAYQPRRFPLRLLAGDALQAGAVHGTADRAAHFADGRAAWPAGPGLCR